jgi:hypothetical protein
MPRKEIAKVREMKSVGANSELDERWKRDSGKKMGPSFGREAAEVPFTEGKNADERWRVASVQERKGRCLGVNGAA